MPLTRQCIDDVLIIAPGGAAAAVKGGAGGMRGAGDNLETRDFPSDCMRAASTSSRINGNDSKRLIIIINIGARGGSRLSPALK